MKLIYVFLIMITSFCIGYLYKNNLKTKFEFYLYLKDFFKNIEANINLFKNNIVEIIDNYLKTKNAKFNEIFVKNGEIYAILTEKLKKYAKNENDAFIIEKYFSGIGSSDYDYEIKKYAEIEKYLDKNIFECENNIKSKGELYFKIALSIGAVGAILIW